MKVRETVKALTEGREMSRDEVEGCVGEIARGEATDAQVGAFLAALRCKGETVEELVSFASALRSLSIRIKPSVKGRLVDTCGTGGDSVKTFNVSTVSALVAAGAGAKVAKHGNRSVTSRCGSADLLEQLGFNVNVEPERVKESIERAGIGFLFAPTFHPAMKSVARIRRELGIRTVFNLMGPLTNPAGADAQLVGVYAPELVPKIAGVLQKLGVNEALVVHGLEGMDEISVAGKTVVSWLKDGRIDTMECSPREFGVDAIESGVPAVSGAEESARLSVRLLGGELKGSQVEKMVLVNSAAALVVAGVADSFHDGVEAARRSILDGSAMRALEELVTLSGGSKERLEVHAQGSR